MIRVWLAAVAFLLLSVAAAGAASGTALGVDPAARLKSSSVVRTLVVGTDVSVGDTVMTDAGGAVQIKFFDGTALVVGPRSALVIRDYLIRDDNSAGKMVLDALSGTFRFVTGSAPKDRYQIRTPGAVLAVRGTAFDLHVDNSVDPPRISVLSYEGAVVMCNAGNSCITLDATCEVGQADSTGAQVLGFGRNAEGMTGTSFRKAFRWAVSETDLLPEFRIREARACGRRSGGRNETPVHDAADSVDTVTPAPGPEPDPEPDPDPPPSPPPPPPPPASGGSCAGHSNPNPGNSQNCNK